MGTKTNNIIKIHPVGPGASRASIASERTHPVTARAVDGFVTIRSTAAARTAHTPAPHVAPHRPVPSKTLMRGAVKKPRIVSPDQLKAQMRTDILARVPSQTVATKVSYGAIHPERFKKAARMIQNPAVSHYGSIDSSQTFSGTSHDNRAAVRSQTAPYQFADLKVAPVPTQPVQPDIFQAALARATSHEQKFDDSQLPKRTGNRIPLLLSVLTCLLLIAGALAYLNVPNLSVRLASSRAGFQAKLPSYTPVGYTFGNLSYGPDNVTVSYKRDAAHKFDISQHASGWDSQALLTNFVASANKAYQTYERAGRTIYFFGNNTATWVDNGVWYTVNGNNSLNKNQLLDLASSI